MRGADGGVDTGAPLQRRWDVALSFDGAQRDYVERVAEALKARGVRCFYDADEQIELWAGIWPRNCQPSIVSRRQRSWYSCPPSMPPGTGLGSSAAPHLPGR